VGSGRVLDRLFERLADRLADLAAARRPDQLVDVGCGTGSTTVPSRRMGTTAPCVGVDISEPTLSAARKADTEGVTATFMCANAQTYPFEPESFGLIQPEQRRELSTSPQSSGYRGAVRPALCSKLCSDRDASRHIGRHRTELRLRDIDRKSRVFACFVTA
jgi:Methyltransferase domain